MANDTPRQANAVHQMAIPLRWGDIDQYGHLNNTVYFRFFEEARVTWLADLGLAVDGIGEGPVLIQTGATFLKEMNYPGSLRIETLTGRAGRSSLMTYHDLYHAQTGQLICQGEAKLVWVNHDTGKSIPLPACLRELAVNADE